MSSVNRLVSAIIPSYNRADYLGQAIESVLGQTYQQVEIIVVDDGSTDSTTHVLQRYIDRIVYIHQENSGVSAARNKGIANSNGHYIALLDSDDLWEPTKLERQIAFIAGDEKCVCFHGVNWFVDAPENEGLLAKKEGALLPEPDRFGYVENPLTDIIRAVHFLTPTMMTTREIFEDIGTFETFLCAGEDEDWFSRAALKYDFKYLPEELTKVRFHASQTEMNSERSVRSLLAVMERMAERVKNADPIAYRRARDRCSGYLSSLANIQSKTNRREACKTAFKAFRHNPLRIQRLAKCALLLLGYKSNVLVHGPASGDRG